MKFNSKFSQIIFTFLLLIITTSAFAFDISADTVASSKLFSKAIFVLITTIGAFKCFSMAGKEKTSSLGVISLGLILLGWSISFLLSAVNEIDLQLKYLLSVITLLIFLVGTTMTIPALIMYPKKGYDQGKSQAIWALSIGLIFISIGSYSAIDTYQNILGDRLVNENMEVTDYKFEDLNFTFRNLDNKFFAIDKTNIAEDATLIIRRAKPNIYFSIIAERLGPYILDREGLEEIVLSNMKSSSSSMTINNKKEKIVNGMNGLIMDLDAIVSNNKFTYRYWIYEHNGFAYQLIAWSTIKNKLKLQSEFDQLIAEFKLISSDKVAVADGSKLISDYNTNLGFSFDSTGTKWMEWIQLEDDYPLAKIGGEIGTKGVFIITPYCYLNNKPHNNAIRSALLSQFDLEYPSQKFNKSEKITIDNLTTEKFDFKWNLDGTDYESRFSFIESNDCTYLISLWINADKQEADLFNSKLLSMLTFKREIDGKLTEAQLKNSAILYNGSGLYYYNNKNYISALKYFKLAITNDLSDSNYVTNTFDTFNKLEAYKKAISFIESNLKILALNADAYSWLGWFYEKVNDTAKAVNFYGIAFNKGYKSDEDLERYVDLLMNESNFSDAETALNKFATHQNSASIAIKKSEIKRKNNAFDEATTIIELASKDKPLIPNLIFEKIYIHKDQGEYQKAITQADILINEGHASAGAYYQKGDSEYELGWYLHAKKSFESALEYAPNNENIQNYIINVQSMLGEGDSTSISKKIEAVTIPEVINEKIVDLKLIENDYYYLQKVTAYHFNSGDKLRTTKKRRIKISSSSGVKRFSTIEIDYEPLYERAYIDYLVLKDNDGKVLYTANRHDFFVTDAEGAKGDTTKTIHLPVANLATGNVIDYSYTKETISKLIKFPFTHIYHSSSRPVIDSYVYLFGEINQIIYQQMMTNAPQISKNSLAWHHEYPVPYYEEPMQINSSSYLPSLTINHKNVSWPALGDDYLNGIEDKLSISKRIENLSMELTNKLTTKEAKIEAISSYVQENIIYKAIEFGVRGRIPNDADTILNDRYGDCKDHAVLLWALLKAAKINAHLALVNLSDTVNPEFPSLDQFDHMITYIPEYKNGQFIDATSKGMTLTNRVPSSLGNSNAFILDKENSLIKKIPNTTYKDNMFTSIREIQVINNKTSHVKEIFTLSGYSESSFRVFLQDKEPGTRFDWAKEFISSLDRSVNLISFEVKNLLINSKPLILELEYSTTNKQFDHSTILIDDSSLWEYYYLLPKAVSNRKTNFEIRSPINFVSKVTIKLPEGYIANNAQVINSNDTVKFGSYSLHTTSDNNIIVKQFVLSENSGEFLKNDYKIYHEFVKNAVDSLSTTLNIKPKEYGRKSSE